jgi:hypothetical protein
VTISEDTWIPSRSLRDSLYGDLVWHRPHALRRDLVLESGSERLALLRWEKIFSMEAVAICADGRWRMGRHYIAPLRAQVAVRDAATDAVLATFTREWHGPGEVRFADGAVYRWRRSGFWRPLWFWSSDQSEQIVAYRSVLGFTRRFEMEVDSGASRVNELPVLVVLGAYLMALLAARRHAH